MVYFKGIDNSYTLNCLEIYGCVYYSRKRNCEADMRRKLNEKVRRPKNPVNIRVKGCFW